MAKRVIKGYAVVGKQGKFTRYEEPACHPFLIFRYKYEANGAENAGEKTIPVQIIIED